MINKKAPRRPKPVTSSSSTSATSSTTVDPTDHHGPEVVESTHSPEIDLEATPIPSASSPSNDPLSHHGPEVTEVTQETGDKMGKTYISKAVPTHKGPEVPVHQEL